MTAVERIAIYGKGLKETTLYGEIKKVRYEGLDLQHYAAGDR